MRLVWKLLRQHISFPQLAGFFFANLCGMVIVLLSAQFYKDVLPVFTEGDSFMKKDYVIVSKKVSTLGSFVGKSKTFSEQDIAEISEQPFTKGVGAFMPSQFKVSAGMGMENVGLHMSTAMFFESVPDEYVDVNLDKWEFDENERVVPIIIPRNYLNLYNFGFAQSLRRDVELRLIHLGQLALEDGRKNFLLAGFQRFILLVFLDNQIINNIAVYTSEANLFELLLQHAHHRNVQLSIHQQHIVSFIRSGLYVAVLFIFIVGIQINQISILIRLVIFNQRLILFESIIFAVCIGEKGKILGSIIEIFLRKHSVVDEDFQVIPLFLKLFTVILEDRLQTV